MYTQPLKLDQSTKKSVIQAINKEKNAAVFEIANLQNLTPQGLKKLKSELIDNVTKQVESVLKKGPVIVVVISQ